MKKAKNNLREWLKVSQLKAGMQIAVPSEKALADFGFGNGKSRKWDKGINCNSGQHRERDGDILWDEIVEIKKVGKEKVYDIEVKGTHNFVAGHLIRPAAEIAKAEIEQSGSTQNPSGSPDQHVPEYVALTPKEESEYLEIKYGDKGTKGQRDKLRKHRATSGAGWYGGIFAHNTYLGGNATTTGSLVVGNPTGGGKGDGTINAITYYTNGTADYAEYFYTDDLDLKPGEVVSIDITNPNAVKRTDRAADSNIIGIVSTNPAIVANSQLSDLKDRGSVIVGLLGQVPAKVSDENGEIRPGDSLTSSSQPGILMKASAGDSTVGVALEGLDPSTSSGQAGTIQVLISRRNKSLTVEQVEEKITQRVADMEIEDEVNLLISGAMDNLGMEEKINEVNVSVVDLASQSDQLDIQVNDLEQQVENLKSANEFDEMISVRALTIDEISNELDVDKFDNTKTAKISGSVENINLMRDSGLSSINNNSTSTDNVKSTTTDELENETSVEMGGIEPPSSWMISQNTRQATPTADLLYHNLDEFISLPEAGDVLVMDPENDLSAVKNYEKNSNKILGVALKNSENAKARLVLNGSAQVKISLENGEIKKGDLLTTSSMPGYAMKAIDENAGIIGIALENYLETDNLDNNKISVLLAIRNNVQINEDDGELEVVDAGELEKNKGEIVVSSNAVYEGDLRVAGKVIFESSLVVIKSIEIQEDLSVLGAVRVAGDMDIKQNLNLEGAFTAEFEYASNTILAIGDAVGIGADGLVKKVRADIASGDEEQIPAIGLVVGVVEDTRYKIQDTNKSQITNPKLQNLVRVAVGGIVGGFKNLQIGKRYYLANSTWEVKAMMEEQGNQGEGGDVENVKDKEITLTSLMPVRPEYYNEMIQVIGIAKSESEMLIMPSLDYLIVEDGQSAPAQNVIYNNYVIQQDKQDQLENEAESTGLISPSGELDGGGQAENPDETAGASNRAGTENIESEPELVVEPAPSEPIVEVIPAPEPTLAPEAILESAPEAETLPEVAPEPAPEPEQTVASEPEEIVVESAPEPAPAIEQAPVVEE